MTDPVERFVKAAREMHDRMTGGHGYWIPLRDAIEAVADLEAAWCPDEDCEGRQGFVVFPNLRSAPIRKPDHDFWHKAMLLRRCGYPVTLTDKVKS